MNPHIAVAFCIVACVGGAAIPATPVPRTETLNLTASNIEITVASLPGMIWYGSPEADDRVIVMPASIRELDAKGEIVNFKEGTHLYSSLNTTVWNISETFETDVEGVAATGVNLTSTLSNNAQLVLTALLFKEDGIVSTELDQFNVTAGALKLNLELRDWGFCKKKNKKNGCKGKGRFLEMDFGLKGFVDTIEFVTNNTWNLGEDVMLWLNPEAEIDEDSIDLRPLIPLPLVMDATNSPIVFQDNVPNNYTTNLIRVRFPQFSKVVMWDAYIW
jgi:hypothetical protein